MTCQQGNGPAISLFRLLLSYLLLHNNNVFGGQSSAGHTSDNERIEGGQIIPPGKYPSLARIEKFFTDGTWGYFGAATIINSDWLLTSGGVFTSPGYQLQNISRLRVIVGGNALNETEPYQQTVYIEHFLLHEKFDVERWIYHKLTHDIALIKVTPRIKFRTNRVNSVNLPSCKEHEQGTGWIAGWGYRNERVTATVNISRASDDFRFLSNDRPREIDTELSTIEKCNQRFAEIGLSHRVTNLYLCTLEKKGKGICWGDRGAPLFLINDGSHMVQVGIAGTRPNFREPCGSENQVTTFTRVSKYVGWIHRRISGCGNHPVHPETRVIDY